jgi:hypothetical protein
LVAAPTDTSFAWPGNFTDVVDEKLATVISQRVQPLMDKMGSFFGNISGLTTVSPCIKTKLAELGRVSFSSASAVSLLSLGLYDCRALQTGHDLARQDNKPQTELLWLMEGSAVVKNGDLTRVNTVAIGNTTASNAYYLYIPRSRSLTVHSRLQFLLTLRSFYRNIESTLSAVPSDKFAANNTVLSLQGLLKLSLSFNALTRDTFEQERACPRCCAGKRQSSRRERAKASPGVKSHRGRRTILPNGQRAVPATTALLVHYALRARTAWAMASCGCGTHLRRQHNFFFLLFPIILTDIHY